MRRGVLQAGEKVQLTDRKGKFITIQLVTGGSTDTQRGVIAHDDIIGNVEGSVITTHSQGLSARSSADTADVSPQESTDTISTAETAETTETTGIADVFAGADEKKPWKRSRAIGGWQYTVMRPRLMDFILSMPRGAQIMYPKDIAQVLELADIRSGMRVLESGGGSGAMSLHILEAIGEAGELATIEMRPEFAKVCEGNATVWFGQFPSWWNIRVGQFDEVAQELPEQYYDRVVLDMLDPWNRVEGLQRVLVPGGIVVAYVTTTTQVSRFAETLRATGSFTDPQVSELLERQWKVDALAVRPQHDMIGHTGFLVVSRMMAPGVHALTRKERSTKDNVTDIDSLSPQEQQERLEELTLRDISDRKLRKVLHDLETQISHLP